jgi:hypothetical protein
LVRTTSRHDQIMTDGYTKYESFVTKAQFIVARLWYWHCSGPKSFMALFSFVMLKC